MTEESGSENSDLGTKIVDVMASNPKGVSNAILLKAIPSLTNQSLVDTLNMLITQNKIEIFHKGKQLLYKLKNSSSTGKFQSADIEEKVIFEAIERAANNGVTSKDLKYKCNLPAKTITEVLKKLESKKLIKCVTPAPRKKFFLLYDLEPSSEITGGTFCKGEEFESEFVDVLGDQCYKYLLQAKATADQLLDPILQRNASYKSSKDIHDYINNLKISKVKLSVQDIENILDALIYDEKIEKCVSVTKSYSSKDKNDTENLYRVTKPLIASAGLMRMPCGVCLVYQDCHEGGEISPSTCVYMKEWLEF